MAATVPHLKWPCSLVTVWPGTLETPANQVRPKQKKIVLQVTGPKNLGRVGREIFFIIYFFHYSKFIDTLYYTEIKIKRLHQWQ